MAFLIKQGSRAAAAVACFKCRAGCWGKFELSSRNKGVKGHVHVVYQIWLEEPSSSGDKVVG